MAADLLPTQDYPEKQPLRFNTFSSVTNAAYHEAYEICLEDEAAARSETSLMYARCLGYLLLELDTRGSRDVISHAIIQRRINNEDTSELAEIYINQLIRLFRQYNPTSSYIYDQPPFEIDASIESSPRDHAAAKRAALKRDNFRCMVTGKVDTNYFELMTPAERAAVNFQYITTNFCHIFPPSTNWGLRPDINKHPKTRYSGSVCAIINGFKEINVLSELNGDKTHSLTNGLTLCTDSHTLFDNLCLWFEEQVYGWRELQG